MNDGSLCKALLQRGRGGVAPFRPFSEWPTSAHTHVLKLNPRKELDYRVIPKASQDWCSTGVPGESSRHKGYQARSFEGAASCRWWSWKSKGHGIGHEEGGGRALKHKRGLKDKKLTLDLRASRKPVQRFQKRYSHEQDE